LAIFLLSPLLGDVIPNIDPPWYQSGLWPVYNAVSVFIYSDWRNVVFYGIWFVLLLSYGLFNNFTFFRFLLTILSSTALIDLLHELYIGNILPKEAFNGVPISILDGIVVPLCWIVCLLLMTFNKNTGRLLRIATILLSLFYLSQLNLGYFLIFHTKSAPHPVFFNSQFFIPRLYDISATLFFYALSYTEVKPRKLNSNIQQPKSVESPQV
jgi:hypothetical protein